MKRKTIENYVEHVYEIQQERGRVHTSDIACALQISPASVTEVLQKLGIKGYLDYEKYAGTLLTKKGENLARKVKKRHRVLKEFLLLLGVDAKVAERDACEMEHVLNSGTIETAVKFVETIKSCEITPLWLQRFIKYSETGKLPTCPMESSKACVKYLKNRKRSRH